MSAPIHFEVEVLYATTFATACGAKNTGKNVTVSDEQVTCRKCLNALGYETAPAEQLTETHGDPFFDRKAA